MSLSQALFYFLAIYFSLLVFYCIGHLLWHYASVTPTTDTTTSVFGKTFTGLLVILTLYAALITKGKTILLGNVFIGIAILLGYQRYKEPSLPYSITLSLTPVYHANRLLLIVAAASFLLFGLLSIVYLPDYPPAIDSFFYAHVSDSFNLYATENNVLAYNFIDEGYKAPIPYHYLELWLNALLVKVCALNSVLCYIIVVPAILCSIIALGLYQLTIAFITQQWLRVLLVFLIMSIALFNVLSPSFVASNYTGYSIFQSSKVTVVYLYILATLLTWRSAAPALALPVLLLCCIASINATPAVTGGVALFIVLNKAADLYYRRESKYTLYWTISILITVAYIGLFYSLFSDNKAGSTPVDWNFMLSHISTARNIMLGNSWHALTSIFVLLLPFIFFFKETKIILQNSVVRSFLLLVVCISIAGSVTHGVFFLMSDAFQFFTIPTFTGVVLLVSLGYLFLLKKEFKYKFVCSILIFLILGLSSVFTWNTFTTSYFQRASRYTTERKNYEQEVFQILSVEKPEHLVYFYVKDKEYFTDIYRRNPLLIQSGNFLSLFHNDFMGIMLNGPDVPINEPAELAFLRNKKIVEGGIFYQYCRNNNIKDENQLRLQFITDHKLFFGFFQSESNIPSNLQRLIKHKITDPSSGEVFVWLNI